MGKFTKFCSGLSCENLLWGGGGGGGESIPQIELGFIMSHHEVKQHLNVTIAGFFVCKFFAVNFVEVTNLILALSKFFSSCKEIVGSTEAPSKVFLLFFLLSDWL